MTEYQEFNPALAAVECLARRVTELERISQIHYVNIVGDTPPSITYEQAINLILDHLDLQLVPQTKVKPHLAPRKNKEETSD